MNHLTLATISVALSFVGLSSGLECFRCEALKSDGGSESLTGMQDMDCSQTKVCDEGVTSCYSGNHKYVTEENVRYFSQNIFSS